MRPILAEGGLLGGNPCRWQSCSSSGRQAAHGPRGFGPRIEAEGSAETRAPKKSRSDAGNQVHKAKMMNHDNHAFYIVLRSEL